MEDVALLSVKFGDWFWMESNIKLVQSLNPSFKSSWVIVNNDLEEAPDSVKKAGLTLIRGADRFSCNDESHHHAQAIHIGLQHIRSRFMILMDPDFYVIRPDWINLILQYMQEQNLAILGSPWHPRWFHQPQGFPSPHFFAVDLSRIDKKDLNFQPGIQDSTLLKIAAWLKNVKLNTLAQCLICGKFPDTGHEIRKRFLHDPKVRWECLPIVIGGKLFLKKADGLTRFTSIFFSGSFDPSRSKDAGDFPHGFLSDLSGEAVGAGWEEFYFKGQPFAFHLRCFGRRDKRFDLNLEKRILSDVLGKIHGRAI